MFFAMGISWLAEFLSWVLGWHYGRQPWVVGVSFFFDVINASQVKQPIDCAFRHYHICKILKRAFSLIQWILIFVNVSNLKKERMRPYSCTPFQGIILFLVLFLDSRTVARIRGYASNLRKRRKTDRAAEETFTDQYRLRDGVG